MRTARVSSLLIVASTTTARAELLELCAALDHVRVIGNVNVGAGAIQVAEAQRPDMVLVAAPLPDMSSGDLVRHLPIYCRHATVVVTSDAHEVPPSLEMGVAECIVRPLTAEALSAALICARARAKTALHQGGRGGRPPFSTPQSRGRAIDVPLVLVGERERRLYPLDPSRVECIQSADNYVKYWVGRTEYIARDTIKRLQPLLSPLGFIQIQRSVMISVRAIAYVEPVGRRVFVFELASGERVRSTPKYSEAILDVLPLRRRESIRGGRRHHPLAQGDV